MFDSTVVNPTCVKSGYTSHHCASCNTSYITDITAPHGHSYDDPVTLHPPTCTEDGEVTIICTVCGDCVTQTVPALGHKCTEEEFPPTCNISGHTTYTCDTCGTTYADNYLPPLGHNFANYIPDNNASCNERGTKTAHCSRCQTTDTVPNPEDPALGHEFKNYTSDNNETCTSDGTCTAQCTRCDVTHTKPLVNSSQGHQYTDYLSDNNATCTADGTKTAKCTRCNITETVADPDSALDHNYGEWITVHPATEEKEGLQRRSCSRCQNTEEKNTATLSHTHSYSTSIKKPTCTEDGYTTYTCTCGDTYTGNKVAAAGHDYEAEVTKPTCTEGGYTTYTCACGDTYIGDRVAATSHDYISAVEKPTCTEAGSTTYTCSCGSSYTDEITPATGHSYSDFHLITLPTETSNGVEEACCNHCNHTISRTYICPHSETYTVSSAPTIEEEGFIDTKCTLCKTLLQHQSLAKLEYISLDEITPISPFSHLPEKTKSICEALIAHISDISSSSKNDHPGLPVIAEIKLTIPETEQVEDALRLYYGCYYPVRDMLIFNMEKIDDIWHCVRIYLDVEIAIEVEAARVKCEAKYLEAYKTFTKGDHIHLAKQIFDYLESTAAYDPNKADVKNLLFEGGGSCNAFSVAFRQMCLQLGVPCDLIAGYTKSGAYHAWNRVRAEDGTWMYFDISFWKTTHADLYRGGEAKLHTEKYFNSYE